MVKVERVPVVCIRKSLVGIGGKPPHPWGNYFWMPQGRVLNFWWENLGAARDQFLPDGCVDIRKYYDGDITFVVIDDPRIPKDWYYNKLCHTGCRRPSKEVAAEIYAHLGDPGNEMQVYADPAAYYAKRGWSWDPKSGAVSRLL